MLLYPAPWCLKNSRLKIGPGRCPPTVDQLHRTLDPSVDLFFSSFSLPFGPVFPLFILSLAKRQPQLSGISKELAGVEERGLREEDLRAIMSMMGPSDLSEVEDEVKVIQQNFRAWILRCNYKSLRKAAKTLQVGGPWLM